MPKSVRRSNLSDQQLKKLQHELAEFADERDWNKFHSPKNLAMALSVEASELVEIFQWCTEEQSQNLDEKTNKAVSEEMADIMIYLLRFADKVDIDIIKSVEEKIQINHEKYPVEKAKGIAKKYDEL